MEQVFDQQRAAWKESLNPAQFEAVTCGDGPVLVIAGAGTGKTWTLACRVAYLIERGVPPDRILLLTFSRRAAREMLSRAGRLVDRQRAGRVWGGTFHATANRLLRIYGRALGVSPDFTLLDQADMADLMDLIRGEQHPTEHTRARRFPQKDTLVAIYSRIVNAAEPLSSVLERAFPWCRDDGDGIRAIFAEYTRRKRVQNVLDYDDLLLFWRALGETSSGLDVARLFEHVLVDEYQDTNPLQAQILQALRPDRLSQNVMVVGDDAQAIYAFRAASVRNILDFPLQFPGARRITLEQNYRSTRPVLDVSNAVIAQARERFPKNLWPVRSGGAQPVLLTCADENEQSSQVCDHVLEHREQGTPLRKQAVLFRTGHHSDLLELELTRRNIPFVKYGGLKFLESAHIKDALALMRVLENPRDEVSWFRVLQLLEGIGPAAARAIMRSIGVSSRADPAGAVTEGPPRVPEMARTSAPDPRRALTEGQARRPDDATFGASTLDSPPAPTEREPVPGAACAASPEPPRTSMSAPPRAPEVSRDGAPPGATAPDPRPASTDGRPVPGAAPAASADPQRVLPDGPPHGADATREHRLALASSGADPPGPAPSDSPPPLADAARAESPDPQRVFTDGPPHKVDAGREEIALASSRADPLRPPTDSPPLVPDAARAARPDPQRALTIGPPHNADAPRETRTLATPRADPPAASTDSPAPVSAVARAASPDPLRAFVDAPPPAPAAARDGLASLRSVLVDCAGAGSVLPPAAELARIRQFCEPLIEARYSSPQARLQDLEQLEHVAGGYATRSRFLAELALDPPNSTSDLAGPPLLDEDYLILSTIHSAKGGEWDVVHIIHAADGMIPSDMSTGNQDDIEEERRLFYVAVTRARDNLYVYFPLRFYRRPRGKDDTHHFAQLTRFLPESVQSLFERRSAGVRSVASASAPLSVDALLSRLWET